MIKTIALIAVLVLGANSACTSILNTVSGFTAEASAIDATAANYCENLQETGALSCCAVADINTIQTKINTLTATLQTAVGTRDVEIETARKTTVPAVKDKFVTVATKAAAAITAIGDADGFTAELVVLETIQDWNSNINVINAVAQAQYASYQAYRSLCMKELIDLQAKAWCLVCEDGADSIGVVEDTILLTAATKSDLVDACYQYISKAEFQSSILYYAYFDEATLDTLIAALQTVIDAADDAARLTAAEAVVALYADYNPNSSSDNDDMIVEIPTSCTASACEWLEDDVFNNGVLDEDLAIVGGSEVDYTNGVRRLLQSIAKSEGRMLQTAVWAPSSFDSGATITFEDNPGDVDVSGGLRQGALIGSILAVLAVLLF